MESMQNLLMTVGFDEGEVQRLVQENFGDPEDFRFLNEKDLKTLSETYERRTAANGRLVFGMARTKRLIGLMHWIQDCYRCSAPIDPEKFDVIAIEEALARAEVRKKEVDGESTMASEASPGKFKDEASWPEWLESFRNYLSVLVGVNGVKLSYVIRENVDPAVDDDFDDFESRAIACAPLDGPSFKADAKRVHQLLKSFMQGGPGEEWISKSDRSMNGRDTLQALVNHFGGEGNSSRRITEAERLKANLHYKNERSFAFSKFLSGFQRMINIFREEGEPLTEQAKIRLLLAKTTHPQLQSAVASLKFQANTNPDLSFTTVANQLSAEVASLGESQTLRRVAGVRQGRGGAGRSGRGFSGGRGRSGRGRGGRGRGTGMNVASGGNGGTQYRSPQEWAKLSYEERDRIRNMRDAAGERGGTKRKVSAISDVDYDNIASRIISKMHTDFQSPSVPAGDSASGVDSSLTNAGLAFGGRQSRK